MLEKADMNRSAGAAAMASANPKPPKAVPRHRRLLEFALTLAAGGTILAGTLYFVDMRAVGEGLRKIGYGAAFLAGLLAARTDTHLRIALAIDLASDRCAASPARCHARLYRGGVRQRILPEPDRERWRPHVARDRQRRSIR